MLPPMVADSALGTPVAGLEAPTPNKAGMAPENDIAMTHCVFNPTLLTLGVFVTFEFDLKCGNQFVVFAFAIFATELVFRYGKRFVFAFVVTTI